MMGKKHEEGLVNVVLTFKTSFKQDWKICVSILRNVAVLRITQDNVKQIQRSKILV